MVFGEATSCTRSESDNNDWNFPVLETSSIIANWKEPCELIARNDQYSGSYFSGCSVNESSRIESSMRSQMLRGKEGVSESEVASMKSFCNLKCNYLYMDILRRVNSFFQSRFLLWSVRQSWGFSPGLSFNLDHIFHIFLFESENGQSQSQSYLLFRYFGPMVCKFWDPSYHRLITWKIIQSTIP